MAAATVAIVVIAIAAIVLLGWLWWQVPKWQLSSLKPKIPSDNPKERADVEDNFRKTFGQALGGAAVLIGAGFAFFQFREQQSQFAQQQKAAQEQQQTAQNQFREQQQTAQNQFREQQQAALNQFRTLQQAAQNQFREQQQAAHDLLVGRFHGSNRMPTKIGSPRCCCDTWVNEEL